jgi:hypothetical protein
MKNENVVENIVNKSKHLSEKEIFKGSARSRKKASSANQNKILTLHNRWGHPSIEKMKQGIKNTSVIGANVSYDEIKNFEMPICFTCLRGKMKTDTTPLSISDKEELKNFEIICSDIKGPFSKKSVHKNKWFIIFVCAKTNYMVTYPMFSKKQTLEKLIEFKLEYPDMNNCIMKNFQCDEDKMYVAKDLKNWCLKNHIKLQTSPPYHHQSNGLAERSIQSIMDKTRTIMLQNFTPIKFWEEALETATYLLNILPIKKLNWKTPYEVIYNKIPDISHLVPFYSKGVFKLTNDERKDKAFGEKGSECKMLGYYKYGKNQYKVLDVNNKIVNRRDVIFNEIPRNKEIVDEITKEDKLNAEDVENHFGLENEVTDTSEIEENGSQGGPKKNVSKIVKNEEKLKSFDKNMKKISVIKEN